MMALYAINNTCFGSYKVTNYAAPLVIQRRKWELKAMLRAGTKLFN